MSDPVTLPEGQDSFKLNEVCKLASVQPYMLRFWGTEFPQLEAQKTGTGQRVYSRAQVELILDPSRWAYRFNLARAEGLMGEWDKAALDYAEASKLFPNDYATLFNLGQALRLAFFKYPPW